MLDFSEKNVLIIGASSGIGAETARILARQGANVILVARREEKLREVLKTIPTGKKAYYVGDISEIDSIEGLVKRVVAEQGRIDGMVYASGITAGDMPIKNLSYNRLLQTFNTNYFGFVEMVRQVTKRTNYNVGLRIVGISSVASLLGEKAHLAYSASKAAMDASIRCIAKELANKGVCINSVAPSMVNTDMYKQFIELQGEQSEANLRTMDRQYLGVAEKVDVANAITFLLSSEAKHITGITLPVDGGFTTS